MERGVTKKREKSNNCFDTRIRVTNQKQVENIISKLHSLRDKRGEEIIPLKKNHHQKQPFKQYTIPLKPRRSTRKLTPEEY